MDIESFVLGMITIPAGVDFGSIDEQPVQIVLFVIAPRTKRKQYIRYLSVISTMLRDDKNRAEILLTTTPEAIKAIFVRHTELESEAGFASNWNLFHIFVQYESALEVILNMLNSINNSNIVIIDALSTGHFLSPQTLYSSLWESATKNFCKLVIVTVPGNRANEVIRFCEELTRNHYPEGIMVTVQELSYLNGALKM
jgi:hypothetical protein